MISRSNLLITGYAGAPHVTSEQQGACNAGMYGSGKYVFDTGNQFAYEIISNNLIKVCDGYAMNQGRLMGIDNTLYEELIIDNGLQGVKRVDLICMKYTKNAETGIENVEMVVVKGTSGDNYTDPSIVSGDILAGAAEDDFPLYRVKIDGINIVAVEPLFHIMVSAKKIMDKLGTTDISAIGDGTATGAISAINNNLNTLYNVSYGTLSEGVTCVVWSSFKCGNFLRIFMHIETSKDLQKGDIITKFPNISSQEIQFINIQPSINHDFGIVFFNKDGSITLNENVPAGTYKLEGCVFVDVNK